MNFFQTVELVIEFDGLFKNSMNFFKFDGIFSIFGKFYENYFTVFNSHFFHFSVDFFFFQSTRLFRPALARKQKATKGASERAAIKRMGHGPLGARVSARTPIGR